MAQVYTASPDLAVRALYSPPRPSVQSYMYNQIQEYRRIAPPEQAIMIDHIEDIYHRETAGSIAKEVDRLKGSLSNYYGMTHFYYLDSLDKTANPPPPMVPYIMAHPELRNYYIEERVTGYGDLYEDHEPDKVALDHYDYRQVTNGVLYKHDDIRVIKEFYEPIRYDRRALSISDKISTLRTWDYITSLLDEGVDPTSKNNDTI